MRRVMILASCIYRYSIAFWVHQIRALCASCLHQGFSAAWLTAFRDITKAYRQVPFQPATSSPKANSIGAKQHMM